MIKRLLCQLDGRLNRSGAILLEIQFDQGEIIKEYATGIFPDSRISILKDLSGNDRVISIECMS